MSLIITRPNIQFPETMPMLISYRFHARLMSWHEVFVKEERIPVFL
jgi:hypothetical protein